MFDEHDPQQRKQLIDRLTQAGLEAREWNGEGSTRVVVPLIDMESDPDVVSGRNPEVKGYVDQASDGWSDDAYLYLATRSRPEPGAVGVMGADRPNGCTFRFDGWRTVGSVEEAAQAFQNLWDERDTWLADFSQQVSQAASTQ